MQKPETDPAGSRDSVQEPGTLSKEAVRFDGRVLFLSSDPRVVARRIAVDDVALAAARPLRDDTTTDEIAPFPSLMHFGDETGRRAHSGFGAGAELPIPLDGVKAGGFRVI